ncbi:molybdopterin-dependent oxidoreductase [Halobacteriota archaeon]
MVTKAESNFNGIKMKRRTFAKGIVALGAAAAIGLGTKRLSDLELFETASAAPVSETKMIHTTCGMCSANCAEIARVEDGRLVELTGNPDDQVGGGVLCVKGYSGIHYLYNPDRLKYPMKRTNPEKGIDVDPKWVRISWDEAFQITGQKLREVYDTHGPQAIVQVARPKPWNKHLSLSIGTPNHVVHITTCYGTHETIWLATVTGTGRNWTTDYANSTYILSFGWDPCGKAKNPQARPLMEAITDGGAKLVVLDPRLTTTASHADEWIPIKPGTDLAFALSMIYVIINEELYDKGYVDTYTYGFDKLKEHINSEGYTPEWASGITEVPAETIKGIARGFATAERPVLATHKRDAGGPNYKNSWRLSHAEVILNALVGSIDRTGGPIIERKPKFPGLRAVFDFPAYPKDIKELMNEPRIDGEHMFPVLHKAAGGFGKGIHQTAADGILNKDPYEVKAAIFWKHNILSFPKPSRMVEALKTLDFVVVSDINPSELVQMADVALPESVYLEKSGLSERTYFAKYPQVSLRQPVVKTLFDTKGFGSQALGILKAMGLSEYADGISGKKWNEAKCEALGTTWAELKEKGLWDDLAQHPFKDYEKLETLKTPTQKIELYSTMFEEYGYDPMPKWEPKRDMPSAEYPYYYIITRKPYNLMSTNQNDPILREIQPENTVVMHTTTAKRLGIHDGDYVYVESRAGKIRVKAELTEGIRPDCVCVDHGFGHWSKKYTVAYNRGANDGDLIPIRSVAEALADGDPTCAALMEDVCVKVYK